jgi:hypothetical protein
MLLRVSGQMAGEEIDVAAVTGADASHSGVRAGAELVAFAEASVTGSESEVAAARQALRAALGDAATVDAAAVVGNFQRMVRIADGTGIPLDAPVHMLTADLREDLGIDDFASAGHTPKLGRGRRLLGQALQPFVKVVARRFRNKLV